MDLPFLDVEVGHFDDIEAGCSLACKETSFGMFQRQGLEGLLQVIDLNVREIDEDDLVVGWLVLFGVLVEICVGDRCEHGYCLSGKDYFVEAASKQGAADLLGNRPLCLPFVDFA